MIRLRFYNNRKTPHFLNFPINCYGKVNTNFYYLKLWDWVCEIRL